MTFYQFLYIIVKRKDLYVFVRDFLSAGNVVQEKLKICSVNEGELQVCQHEDYLRKVDLVSVYDLGQFVFEKHEFFAVQTLGNLNKDYASVEVDVEDAGCGIHRKRHLEYASNGLEENIKFDRLRKIFYNTEFNQVCDF